MSRTHQPRHGKSMLGPECMQAPEALSLISVDKSAMKVIDEINTDYEGGPAQANEDDAYSEFDALNSTYKRKIIEDAVKEVQQAADALFNDEAEPFESMYGAAQAKKIHNEASSVLKQNAARFNI